MASSTAQAKKYANEGSLDAGLMVPLHLSMPTSAGGESVRGRRLPLRPLAAGIIVNTLLGSNAEFGL